MVLLITFKAHCQDENPDCASEGGGGGGEEEIERNHREGEGILPECDRCLAFHRLISTGGFHKNYQSGRTKNAADFAMMLQIGKMDELLPKHVQFTIFSGDKGFQEALHQMKNSRRTIRIINPHVPGWQARLHCILNRTIP
ncbi:E3 SUMO-protein ligase ZNF451-like [Octopus sinensis]|uniref:E3 SUMO-protein ligase ZNF451-like n=1 Tax=Octopus sinensis TaxID=2607531 RepID=A0A7E6F1E3_9MOLL|nr:E3 SUMO-protein ligase ZNF451-like [Octopus sinensis]